MMLRSAALALMIAASPLVAAPVPKEVEKGGVAVGTWRLESLVAFGKPVEFAAGESQYITIDVRGAMFYHDGPALPEKAEPYALLAFAAKADAVDFRFTGDDDFYRPGKCSLKSDVLKLCFNFKDTGIRPANTDAGAEVFVWTLHRVKQGAKK